MWFGLIFSYLYEWLQIHGWWRSQVMCGIHIAVKILWWWSKNSTTTDLLVEGLLGTRLLHILRENCTTMGQEMATEEEASSISQTIVVLMQKILDDAMPMNSLVSWDYIHPRGKRHSGIFCQTGPANTSPFTEIPQVWAIVYTSRNQSKMPILWMV